MLFPHVYVWSNLLACVIGANLVNNQRLVFTDTARDNAETVADTELPTVKLPYGTWRASSYEKERDVYIFTNIPFAKPPIGALRWMKPVTPPDSFNGIQNGTIGSTCPQILPKYGLNFLGDGAIDSNLAPFVNGIVGNIGTMIFGGKEDCLNLDVYVPGKFIRNRNIAKVPVVNWITGGAFILGSKEFMGLYSGSHLIEQAKGDMIFVSANYRLGVYGWLAGTTVENEATANLGLWDQRAVLQWIQDYAHLFGGDKEQVSAWGESAGASSLQHHLVAFGGLQKPLFKRAVLLSPAFQPLGDRRPKTGMLEVTFKKFEKYVGCENKGFSCLRGLSQTVLDRANQWIQDEAPRGSFGVGVSADGNWSRQFPGAELLQGNVVKNIESLIISHTARESVIFVDGHIKTDKEFEKFITDLFGDLATDTGFVEQVNQIYPPFGDGKGYYRNMTSRVRDFIRDAAFSCNSRYLIQAYNKVPSVKTYGMEFNELAGWHGGDLVALFLRNNIKVNGEIIPLTPGLGALSRTYQSYLISYALTGDPNKLAIKTKSFSTVPAVQWDPRPRIVGENIDNMLLVTNGTFKIGTDFNVPKKGCDFLQNFMVKAQEYAGLNVGPPGTPVQITTPKGKSGGKGPKVRVSMIKDSRARKRMVQDRL